ncbi:MULTISPECIES: hypothetical protein [unclassified Methylophaga]|jgi:uncharacterized membrane protein|uniref:hypothetical protein n=1 Tax=unclassified Methylophaga TaxID=2629249 RepID=UPI00259C6F62|nr:MULTISPECIES: hypothetical protein [unclassified Methylophaga]|tara:strand:+ start:3103 stop:3870 length:768 start_codon:yes stop_codon:yes gene_type:complete
MGFNKVLTYTIIACVLLIICIVGVYVFNFWDRDIGGPGDFADFATYVGNLVMPILTIASVIALLSTLKLQRDQLNEQREQIERQRKADLFESYVKRFEMQYDRFKELIKMNFPSVHGDDYKYHFNLAEYKLLNHDGMKHRRAKEIIESLPQLREVYKNATQSKNTLHEATHRVNVYLDEITMEVNGLHNCLVASYKFTDSNDTMICLDMHKRVIAIFFDLEQWNIITKADRQKLVDHISPPAHLKEFEFESLLIY